MNTEPSDHLLPVSERLSGPLYAGAIRIDELFVQRARTSRSFRLQLSLKRAFDIAVSAVAIILAAPVLLVSILAIRVSSKGPALLAQPRWGLHERQFKCFKLRSMYLNAGQSGNSQGLLLKFKRDPRVTKVGAILRKTSIDELPQLFNVLLGDMSIVGPRPLVLHMLQPFPEIRAVRCVVRPGITGLWQLRNRANNTSVMDMLADDAEYITNLNLLLDLKILAQTPLAVLRGVGAH